MNRSTIEAIIRLDDRVKTATSQFHNSAAAGTVYDLKLGHVFGEMVLTVADVLLVAILSQVHTLVTGPTGRGKTALVALVCQGAFGTNGWFLLRLNPHLNEETFADIDMAKLQQGTLKGAISPANFLSLPCTVLDECNRTPAALTNILLGFCDGRIELKAGQKYEVGYRYNNSNDNGRYHIIIGTMNEGEEYKGTFEIDPALSRRFTLMIPFSELPPTSHDLVNIIENRIGHAKMMQYDNTVDLIAPTSEAVLQLSLDPLAFVYLLYLGNVGRCSHSPSGWKPLRDPHELCGKSECRIAKKSNLFCPSVSGLNEGLLIFLKRAACGLAALRAARTVRTITQTCEVENEQSESINRLQQYAGVKAKGSELCDTVISKYLQNVEITASDIKALLPFIVLGGKVRIAPEYVAKNFNGLQWQAAQHYAQETYAWLEQFLRQQQHLLKTLNSGNGTVDKLKQVLEHAELFVDPFIRQTLEPLLDRFLSNTRSPDEIAEEMEITAPILESINALVKN